MSDDSTHWTLIRRAQGHGPDARTALGELLKRYERTITAMFRSYRRPPGYAPEETTQEFLTRTLARGDILKLDESKGGFRAWLGVAVRHHVMNSWAAFFAAKNPEPHTVGSVDYDVVGRETPERVLLRKFAVDTLRAAEARLRSSHKDRARFDALRPFLPGPDMNLEARKVAAARLGTTPPGLGKELYELRKAFAECLRLTVASTLDLDPDDPASSVPIERELRELHASLYAGDGVVVA